MKTILIAALLVMSGCVVSVNSSETFRNKVPTCCSITPGSFDRCFNTVFGDGSVDLVTFIPVSTLVSNDLSDGEALRIQTNVCASRGEFLTTF